MSQFIDVSTHMSAQSPSEMLRELADEVEARDITSRDVYGSGEWLQNFEKDVAEFTRKECAMYCPSGTMAQQIALQVYKAQCKKESKTFIAHPTSHLLVHEQHSYQHLMKAEVLQCGKDTEAMTYNDLEALLGNDGVRSYRSFCFNP